LKEFVGKFMQQSLDGYLHKNKEMAEALRLKIEENEHERKELAASADRPGTREKAHCTIASCATAACTSETGRIGRRNARSSSSRAIRPLGSLTATPDVQTQAAVRLEGKTAEHLRPFEEVIYRE